MQFRTCVALCVCVFLVFAASFTRFSEGAGPGRTAASGLTHSCDCLLRPWPLPSCVLSFSPSGAHALPPVLTSRDMASFTQQPGGVMPLSWRAFLSCCAWRLLRCFVKRSAQFS